ncbi:hypothetical protein [Micromonospora chalcea]|uniref:hypothetical protein n=1 Tax=Micromonospora chalcea TaxID=1874 RepID=UPI00157DBB58|nr:hypothetical protein [Micromonospora chalcea]
MQIGLFRTWCRENRPLSEYLERRFSAPLLGRVGALSAAELEQGDEEIVKRFIADKRIDPPRLLGQDKAAVRDGDGSRRPTPGGTRTPTSRHYIAIQLEGEEELLECWPDAATSSLQPIDHAFLDDHGNRDGFEERMRQYEYGLAQERWSIGRRSEEGPVALYTFVDLTQEDEDAVLQGTLDIRSKIDAMRAEIAPIVSAIAEQTRTFFENDLPSRLRSALQTRRQQVASRRAVEESLSWPDGWKYPEPKVEVVVDLPPTQPPVSGNSAKEIHVEPRSRLAPATFGDVMRTMRVWADAVERHPKAYANLAEDRISDLLTAALNAALPGAHREVYSRGGKSDIYIRAEAINTGSGPAKVFICECKWWKGAAKASDALDQLLGYLESKDTSAVLMFFVPLAKPQVARTEARTALADREECLRVEDGPTGWPIMHFSVDGREVAICLAFVDLPRSGTAEG